MVASLTSGSILEILNGSNPEKPVMQIISAKKIPNAQQDRYRLLLSDGANMYSNVMLAVQFNHLLDNGEITSLSVVEITKYICNTLKGDTERKVICVTDIKVLETEVEERIGNPVQVNPGQIPKPTTQTAQVVTKVPANSAPSVNGHSGSGLQSKPGVEGKNHLANNNSLNVKGVKPGTPGTPSRVHAIATLTPYQNRWRIRARVTMKSNIRTWSNSRGEGKLFNVNLLDDSGEIRCTGFNEQVDKYFDMLEVNKVYYFSKCTLKTANKQYSTVNNEYEMTMNPETLIEPCNDDVDLPVMTFNFVKIADLEKEKPNSNVDIIGVVKVCNDLSSVIGRQSQKEITKRDLQLVDQSGVAVSVTLWGDDAVKFEGQGFPILAVKAARVSDFGGRSCSVSNNSQMIINPDIKEAHSLRGWFQNEGRDLNFSTYQSEGGSGGGQNTNWKNFQQVKTESLGQGDKPDYFTAKGTVMFLKKDNCMYQACPTAECNKKLIDQGNGLFRCEKCNKEFPNYKWRMILQANVADHLDNQWITCFQESAEQILGIKADDLGAMRQENELQFDQVMREALFKSYLFRLRAKMETYNDESRLKTVCMGATPIDWVDYAKKLAEKLEQLGL